MGQNELYRALQIVAEDATKKMNEHTQLQGGKPLHGWSIEKHYQYHAVRIQEAREVLHYCFVRQMQIDPD